MNKKRGLVTRFKQLSFWNRVAIIGAIASIFGLVLYLIPRTDQKAQISESPSSNIYQSKGDIIINNYETNYYDQNNTKVTNYTDVKVLKQKIINAKLCYMKIRVTTNYLNSNFDTPITLKYESGKYQPVTLTFNNNKIYGAGIIITSPEREKRADVYLNKCIRFEGFGRMTYTKDLVFDLYYDECCIFFRPTQGIVEFERALPPIGLGPLCISYFEEVECKSGCSKKYPELVKYFSENI